MTTMIADVDSISFDINSVKENLRLHRKGVDLFAISVENIDSIAFRSVELTLPYIKSLNTYYRLPSNGLRLFGEIISEGADAVISRGFCWNTESDPTISDNTVEEEAGDRGIYSGDITDLEAGTYYIRAFAKNKAGISYGDAVTCVVDGTYNSLLVTDEIEEESIGIKTCTVSGTLIERGSPVSRNVGVCYALHSEPTVFDNAVKRSTNTPSGYFTCNLTDLEMGETYYVRSYAINSNETDTVYGNLVAFQTQVATLATLETSNVSIFAKKGAIVCGRIADNGNDEIEEWGVCYSTSILPTTEDNKVLASKATKAISSTGEFGVFLDNLEAGTRYYVRTYAKNNAGIAYGPQRTFNTVGKNVVKMTYYVDKAANPTEDQLDAYACMTEALDSAMYYYNNYYNYSGGTKSLWCYYSPGIPTAQASCDGAIGYGSNRSYMWVGTTMHEIAHALGSGTQWTWTSNLLVNGVYQKKNAEIVVRVFNDDWVTTPILKGDGWHFWPGGINYRNEVTRGEKDLKMHALMLTAMRLDGLQDC